MDYTVPPYNGLYREALPQRGTFLRLEVNKRVGISRVGIEKGWENWHLGIQKRLSKCISKDISTCNAVVADSSKYFKGLLKRKIL